MSLEINKNIVLKNPETKAFLADAYFPKGESNLPLLIFVHGYKGYKDWGAWELMVQKIAEAGFYVVKFNFSHNGTTLEDTTNFADLEAFGHNNYSKEMSDLKVVIDYFLQQKEVDPERLALMAHSRGNGNIAIQASEDSRVKALVGLAGISDYGSRFPSAEVIEDIKKAGVVYIENQRTKQQMPHYFQFFEDFKQHENRFNIERAVRSLEIPYLIIHGSADDTVNVKEAEQLQEWSKQSELIIIEDADHGFGSSEPWTKSQMPEDMALATEETIGFLRNILN